MTTDFDAVLIKVGEFGNYQKLIVWLLTIPACFLNAYSGFGLVFQGYTPDFACRPLEYRESEYGFENRESEYGFENRSYVESEYGFEKNKSAIFDNSCTYTNLTTNSTENCKYEYLIFDNKYFDATVVTKFSLVCDKAIYYKSMLSLFTFMSIVGCIGFSVIQDQWGRKKAFMLCLTMSLIGNISAVFAPTLLTYTLLKIPQTLGSLASWNIAYVWALEYVGPSKRTLVTFVLSVCYGVAAVSMGLIAWPCRTWIQMSLVTTVPFLLLYSYWFVLDESPRWLVSQGRLLEAEQVVLKIAKTQRNRRRSLIADNAEINRLLAEVDDRPQSQYDKMSTMKRVICLLKSPNLRYKTLLISWTWFSVTATYCGIAFNMENLGGNLYANYLMQASVEIPATFLILLVVDRYGRVLSLAFGQIVFCSFFAFLSVPAQIFIGSWAVIACSIVMKFGSCLGFAIIVQLASELYPTSLRGSGTGFSSAVGELGNVIMPYIIHSASTYPTLPLLILGCLSLATGIASLFLPETAGQLLPETVEEATERSAVGVKNFKTIVRRIKSGKISLL